MILLNSAQSRELDRIAIQDIGIPEDALMESAGQAVVMAMQRQWGDIRGKRVALLCGKGNNGADGLVAARHLLNEGAIPGILVACAPKEMGAATAKQAGILSKLGLILTHVHDADGLALAKAVFQNSDILVDALFGTGFKGAATEFPAALLIAMNATGKPVVSVDIPSGMDADTGNTRGACAYAALTVTFSLPKLGLALQGGRNFSGTLVVAELGIPMSLVARLAGPFADLSELASMRALLPKRSPWAHKKNAGTLVVVAGSPDYAGAAVLTARGAFASGAAFVHLLVPDEIRAQMQAAVPEAVVHKASLGLALELQTQSHAYVVGPGLGREKAALDLARSLFEKLSLPALFDADALYALAEGGELKAGGPRLLTPHAGEFERLVGGHEGFAADPCGAAREFAKASSSCLLLKGPSTVVASPEGGLGVNATGNASLASAGTGDVLSGVAGALLAQKAGVFEAGRLAAHVHGLAADLRVKAKGNVGLTASELIDYLPAAFSQVEGKA
jgi:hydroxyethylthiazole kinase-like uncharacterized protein yjeF